MKYFVNDSCIGCGLCESTCPEVFHMNGDVAVAIEGEAPEAELSAAARVFVPLRRLFFHYQQNW